MNPLTPLPSGEREGTHRISGGEGEGVALLPDGPTRTSPSP
ncbi:hypothetical protein [Azospirillum argentinense]|uniref:Uncharacterized protein n=1 Tax=Azospirillum argentinense TaxID=2970906 RepID=A0A5B0L223_9PROT|nr:hypothetical protein FH063_001442 [Azospirillum argentinense]